MHIDEPERQYSRRTSKTCGRPPARSHSVSLGSEETRSRNPASGWIFTRPSPQAVDRRREGPQWLLGWWPSFNDPPGQDGANVVYREWLGDVVVHPDGQAALTPTLGDIGRHGDGRGT